ncbi:MAG TPA: aminodeoxychorismate synthase component I, partial [Pseudomonadales bacterium]
GPPPALPAFVLDEPFRPLTPAADYRRDIARIHDYIVAGDCYQVNYAMPFTARYHGHSFAAYCRLRDTVPSPYMAYINAGRQQILSISPECFIEASGQRLSSRPIKGTAARAADAGQDRQQAEALQQSAKNRAENVMIVDLIRNDFSRFSRPHSVQVEALCQLESYANVHHLVSTVNAELAAPYTVWDVFFASFPGGSITGAPKIRACQIINELEQHNREIYCGSVFAASDNGRFSASIAIRTLLCDNGRISAWAGGGIVADSTADEEYQECLNKIGALLDAL